MVELEEQSRNHLGFQHFISISFHQLGKLVQVFHGFY